MENTTMGIDITNLTSVLTTEPDPPLGNASLQIACTSTFGLSLENVSVTIEQENTDGGFGPVPDVDTKDVSDNCMLTRKVSKGYTPDDQSWNGTRYRCKTEVGGTVTYSDPQLLLAEANPVAEVNVSLIVTNLNYTDDMANSSSQVFQDFQTDFCNWINKLFENHTDYHGCQVDKLESGSVVVTFIISFSNCSVAEVDILITITNGEQNTTLKIGIYITQASSVIVNSVKFKDCTTTTESPTTSTSTSTSTSTTTTEPTSTATSTTESPATSTSTSTSATESPTTSTSTSTSTSTTKSPTTSTATAKSTTDSPTTSTSTSTATTESPTTSTSTAKSTTHSPTTSTSTSMSTSTTESPTTSTSTTESPTTSTPETSTTSTSASTSTSTTASTSTTTVLPDVASPKVYFMDLDQTGVVGMSHTIKCKAEDVSGLSEIVLSKGSVEFLIAKYNGSAGTDTHVNLFTSSIHGNDGLMVVEIIIIACDDKGEYMCTAFGDVNVTSNSSNLDIERVPESPVLTFTQWKQPINGQNFLFSCSGEVGDPARLLVLQSTENTEGFSDVTTDTSPDIEQSACSNVANLDLNHTVTTSKTEVSYRCAVKDENGTVVESSAAQTVHVFTVTDDDCNLQSGDVRLAADCHSYVFCFDGRLDSTNAFTCTNQQCFSEVRKGCVTCSDIGGCDTETQQDDFTCDSPVAIGNGTTGTINCALNNGTLSSVSVTKEDGTIIFSGVDNGEHDNDRFSLVVYSSTARITLEAAKCGDAQRLVVTANGQYTTWSSILVPHTTTNHTPNLTTDPDTPLENAFLQIACASTFGLLLKNVSVTMEKEITEAVFESVTDVVTEDFSDKCILTRKVSKWYTDQSWNGVRYRCKAEVDGRATYSDPQLLVAAHNPVVVSFLPAEVTAAPGNELNVTCTVTGDTDLQNITLMTFLNGIPSVLAIVNSAGATAGPSTNVVVSGQQTDGTGGSITALISSVTCEDQAMYACLRNGGDPSAISTVTVTGCP